MKKVVGKKVKKIVAALLVVSSLALGATVSNAYLVWYSDGFSPVSTDLHCNANLMRETKLAISNSCLEWNTAGAGSLIFRGTDTSNNTYKKDNDSNDVSYGQRGTNTYIMQTHATSTSWSSITEADIDINTSFPWANNGSSSALDIRASMTHEIGHLLGLDESPVIGATMHQGLAYGDLSPRTIEQDDKNGINDIY